MGSGQHLDLLHGASFGLGLGFGLGVCSLGTARIRALLWCLFSAKLFRLLKTRRADWRLLLGRLQLLGLRLRLRLRLRRLRLRLNRPLGLRRTIGWSAVLLQEPRLPHLKGERVSIDCSWAR